MKPVREAFYRDWLATLGYTIRCAEGFQQFVSYMEEMLGDWIIGGDNTGYGLYTQEDEEWEAQLQAWRVSDGKD